MINDTAKWIDDSTYDVDLQYINVSFGLSCLLLLFAVLGSITSFISIVVYSHPAMRSSINVLLTGLSVVDLCLCVSAVPTFIFPSLCLYLGTLNGHPHHALCTLATYSTLYVYPITTMTQTCSVWTFVIITFERWIAVCRPFRARWATTGRSLRALGMVCALSAAYNFIRFFEYIPAQNTAALIRLTINETLLINESDMYGNGILVDEFLRKDESYMKIYYSGLYLVTHFLIPFSVLAGVNGRMIYSIHQARQQRRMLSNSEKKEHRTALMMGLVVLMFLCCNTLTFVLNFVEQLDKNLFLYRTTKIMMFTLNDVSNLLVLLNASATFGFYYTCSQKYRQLLHYYWINYWCAPCVLIACPSVHEVNRSRLRNSKMAFSFHSAISLCAPPSELVKSTSPRTTLTVQGRRCSTVMERCNNNGHAGFRDEQKCLIPGQYLCTKGGGRRWSAVTLSPPTAQNHLTVPLSQHAIISEANRRRSNMSVRSAR